MHHITDLMSLFDETFFTSYHTRLIKGQDEPIYLPADHTRPFHQIVFAHGYFASALHEIAHWLVAGEERRLQEDYGYWYCPDGRDEQQQAAFQAVEVKPQAIEWMLCAAAGFKFNVSCDNLNGVQPCRVSFQREVYQRVMHLLAHGVNARTQSFLCALAHFYGTPWPMTASQFIWHDDLAIQPQEACHEI